MIGYLYAWLWASGNLRNKPKVDDTEYEYVETRNTNGEKVFRKQEVQHIQTKAELDAGFKAVDDWLFPYVVFIIAVVGFFIYEFIIHL
jgi:hypothetical protein